ncbi:hypothetical protein vseg_011910 [Gypsophila vaccaria]
MAVAKRVQTFSSAFGCSSTGSEQGSGGLLRNCSQFDSKSGRGRKKRFLIPVKIIQCLSLLSFFPFPELFDVKTRRRCSSVTPYYVQHFHS